MHLGSWFLDQDHVLVLSLYIFVMLKFCFHQSLVYAFHFL
jgi:hypothetical protein